MKKKEIILKLKEDSIHFNDFPLEFKNDKEVILAAVSNYGMFLKYASDNLKNDREVVLSAVSKTGSSLQYASDDLKNNKYIVLAAITQNAHALKYASNTWKNDYDMVFQATSNNGLSLKHAAQHFQNNIELLQLSVDKIYFNDNEHEFHTLCKEKLKILKEHDFLNKNVHNNNIQSKSIKF